MDILRAYAFEMVGKPYRWKGDDPINGFDCSGLVIELLQSYGLLPRNYDASAQMLHDYFKSQNSEIDKKGFGSLVFFGKSISEITHIGFMIDERRMIEAGGGTSETTSSEKAAEQNAFIRIRPLTWRKDVVAILRPNYEGVK